MGLRKLDPSLESGIHQCLQCLSDEIQVYQTLGNHSFRSVILQTDAFTCSSINFFFLQPTATGNFTPTAYLRVTFRYESSTAVIGTDRTRCTTPTTSLEVPFASSSRTTAHHLAPTRTTAASSLSTDSIAVRLTRKTFSSAPRTNCVETHVRPSSPSYLRTAAGDPLP